MTDNIAQIYRKYGPMVFRRCQGLLPNEADAAEAMQDTFVRFFARYGGNQEGAVSSLLYRIATHVCLNRIRSEKRHPTMSDQELPDVLLDIADRSELESRVIARNFIAKLFSMDQESTAWMAVLFYHDGMTLEEIAQEAGLSVSGVRKRLRKFGRNLRKLEACDERRG